MLINGTKLSQKIIHEVEIETAALAKKGVNLCLAIVTLGPEESWEKYVNQKIKLAKKLGIATKLINIVDPTEDKLISLIEQLNNDNNVTGIIVQRPLTRHIKKDTVIYAVSPKKDIDGFIKNAYFKPPVWLAVKYILETIYNLQLTIDRDRRGVARPGGVPSSDRREPATEDVGRDEGATGPRALKEWLKTKNIAVLGKGETAGMPVIEGLKDLGVKPLIVDSKTENKSTILKSADIVISAVGKREIFKADELKKGVIVIAIGLHREDSLKPDFNENEIKKIAKYYTPTPGGVGPINLAYLFKNLAGAAKI